LIIDGWTKGKKRKKKKYKCQHSLSNEQKQQLIKNEKYTIGKPTICTALGHVELFNWKSPAVGTTLEIHHST